MKKIVRFPDRAAIDEEAASWLIQLDRGGLSEAQKAQLRLWLARDPRHGEAFGSMARLWDDLSSLELLAELFPEDATPAVRSPMRSSGVDESRPSPWYIPAAAWPARVVIALLVAIALGFGGWAGLPSWSTMARVEPVELVYETARGKHSRTLLRDGSTMRLNSATRARVTFEEDERAIILEAGEAFFEVAKDPRRPFIVYAGAGRVSAIGTAFTVRMRGSGVDVAVTHGTVEVATRGHGELFAAASKDTPDAKVTLQARGVATYHQTIESHTYLAPAELRDRLAWIDGKWIFEGETLEDVIAEANRQSDVRLEIIDPAIADIRIGGYFDIGDIETLLDALQRGFGVQVTRASDRLVLLSASDEASAVSNSKPLSPPAPKHDQADR